MATPGVDRLVEQAIEQGFGPTVTDPVALRHIGRIARTAKPLATRPTHCPTCGREIGPEGCPEHPAVRRLEDVEKAS